MSFSNTAVLIAKDITDNIDNIDNLEYSDHDDMDAFCEFTSNNSLPCRLKIVHMNIRSMNANFGEFQHLLTYLPVDLDIIVLTETWSINSELYNNSLPGFSLVASSQCNKAGGVFIFFSKYTINPIDSDRDLLLFVIFCSETEPT